MVRQDIVFPEAEADHISGIAAAGSTGMTDAAAANQRSTEAKLLKGGQQQKRQGIKKDQQI